MHRRNKQTKAGQEPAGKYQILKFSVQNMELSAQHLGPNSPPTAHLASLLGQFCSPMSFFGKHIMVLASSKSWGLGLTSWFSG